MKRKIFLIILMPLILCMFSLTGSIYAQKKTTTTTVNPALIKPSVVKLDIQTLKNKRITLTAEQYEGVKYYKPDTRYSYYIINAGTGRSLEMLLKPMMSSWSDTGPQKWLFLPAENGLLYFKSYVQWGPYQQPFEYRYSRYLGIDATNNNCVSLTPYFVNKAKFAFEDAGDNYYYIKFSSSYLTDIDFTANELRFSAKTANLNQKYLLVKAE